MGCNLSFKIKVVLSEKNKWNSFYNFPERVFSSISVIQTFTDLDKGSLTISLN
jgi:hypothetical protein